MKKTTITFVPKAQLHKEPMRDPEETTDKYAYREEEKRSKKAAREKNGMRDTVYIISTLCHSNAENEMRGQEYRRRMCACTRQTRYCI